MTESRTFVEHIEVAGDQLVSTIKRLYNEGDAKRAILRTPEGKELLAVPLNVGVIGGGLVVLAAPILAAVTALAAVVTNVKLEIVREIAPVTPPTPDDEAASGPTATHQPTS